MRSNEPEIPTAAVADLLEQLATTSTSDPDLIAILNASATADPPCSADLNPSELAMQLKVDVAGYTAALRTLAQVRQMSLADFVSDETSGGTQDDT